MRTPAIFQAGQAAIDYLQQMRDAQADMRRALPTRFQVLDDWTGGLKPGTLTVIGGRPAMGKSALAISIANRMVAPGRFESVCEGGEPIPVAYFTPDQNGQGCAEHLLLSWSGVCSQRMRRDMLEEHHRAALDQAIKELQDVPLFINRSVVNFDALRIALMHLVYGKGVRVAFIDNVQSMPILHRIRDHNGEEVRLEKALRSLAVEFNIAVVCLSNISRPPEGGPNQPRLADLREFGTFEQDADVIAVLHREAYYHCVDPDTCDDPLNDPSCAQLLILKNVGGPTGLVKLHWKERSWRFDDYSWAAFESCLVDDPSIPI